MSIQSIRDNSQSVLAKTIVGVIVVTFALFGVDAIIGYSSNANNVAEVNGNEISTYELNRATEMLRRQILDRMGENADPSLLDEKLIRSRALDSLLERQILLQDAEEHNIYTSQGQVESTIMTTPGFQVDGVFNPAIYEAAVRNIGLMPREYKSQLALDMQVQQPQSAIMQSAFMVSSEVKQIAELDRQLRNIAYLKVKTEDLLKDIVISDISAKEHYEANQQEYMTPELVQLEYLELNRSDFMSKVDINDLEIKQLYEQEVERYKQREERRAAHILIEIGKDTDEKAAREKMDEVLEKLAAGESFESLAKVYSQDLGSAKNGGDLGYAERGAYDETFEDTLYSLSVGQTSEVIKTEFGLHLIRLLDARKLEIPSFEDLAAELEQGLRFQKSEELFVEQADKLQNDSFSAGDLREPAARSGLQIQTTELFSREGGKGIAENANVVKVAFSDEVLTEGNNSDLIQLGNDHVVVVRVKQHQPAKVKPYDEVADEVIDLLKRRRASQQAQKLGEQLLVELREGKSTEQITSDYGFEWNIVDKVGRDQQELDPQINEAVFKMPKPAVGEKSLDGLIMPNGDFAVIALTKVYEGGLTEISPREIEVLGRMIANQLGRYDFQDYLLNLKQQAKIEKY